MRKSEGAEGGMNSEVGMRNWEKGAEGMGHGVKDRRWVRMEWKIRSWEGEKVGGRAGRLVGSEAWKLESF